MRRLGQVAPMLASVAVLSVAASCGPRKVPRNDEEAKLVKDLVDGKSVDLFAFQGGGVEYVCRSGAYQRPVSDINYSLRRNFISCSGRMNKIRDDGIGAISFIWPDRCHVLEVYGSEFYVETQNGTSCFDKTQARFFKLKPWPYGQLLDPSD